MRYHKNRLFSQIICGLFCSFAIIACGGSKQQELDRRIKRSLRDSPGIDAQEFTQIRDLIQSDEALAFSYEGDSTIIDYINTIGEELSQTTRNPIEWPITIDTGKEDGSSLSDNSTELHFFYENSASMDGYLNGNTNFTDAIPGLLARSSLNNDKINLYYINREAYPVDTMIDEFVDILKPENVRRFGGKGRTNSEINRILGIVTDTIMRNPDRIGVIVSDYIYSINDRDVSRQLNFQKNTTITNLRRLGNGDYAILIIKINSMFNGLYYDMKNGNTRIFEERPFFIWVIGAKDKILGFPKRYRIHEYKGYETHLVLLKQDDNNRPYYTVLSKTCKEGAFERADRSSKSITTIEDAATGREGILQFGIAIDLSKCPVDSAYLSNTENYKIKTSTDDPFIVTAVLPISDIAHNDRDLKGSATHIIQVTTKKISKGAQTIQLELKKNIPAWVANSSTECDTTAAMRKGKTFGFNYLVDGAKTVFDYTPESHYFNLPITIKR